MTDRSWCIWSAYCRWSGFSPAVVRGCAGSIFAVQIQPRKHLLDRPCGLYGAHPATWAISYRSYRSYISGINISSCFERSRSWSVGIGDLSGVWKRLKYTPWLQALTLTVTPSPTAWETSRNFLKLKDVVQTIGHCHFIRRTDTRFPLHDIDILDQIYFRSAQVHGSGWEPVFSAWSKNIVLSWICTMCRSSTISHNGRLGSRWSRSWSICPTALYRYDSMTSRWSRSWSICPTAL